MVTECAILLPLVLLAYQGYIPWELFLGVVIIVYWLPKWLMLGMLVERFYPTVLTRRMDNASRQIALTFDDLPYGSHREIIAALDAYEMKGTFFLISDYFDDKRDMEVFVNAVKNGHQLGNHGKTNTMHALLSASALETEIRQCDALIRRIYTIANKPLPGTMSYRPGCGLFHQAMLDVVHAANYRLTLGSVYPDDPIIPLPYVNYQYILQHIEAGDIVILHDRTWTVSMLEKLLPWLKARNYTSVTVNDLFK